MQILFKKAQKYIDTNPTKAVSLFKKILAQQECKEAWANMGVAYRNLDNNEKATECLLKANDPLVPYSDYTFSENYPLALNNLGLIAYTHEQDEAAVALYKKSLSLEPLNYSTIWNLAETRLRQYCSFKYTNLEECWKLYEYRLKREGGVVLKNKKKDLIEWNGLPVDHLVILAEQGIGDMIMFGRYLSLLPANKITVQCDKRMAGLFPYDTCLDPSETTATHGIAMCSLGKFFDYIPRGDWIDTNAKPLHKPTNIGVTWSGSSSHSNNRNRSTTAGRFLQLNRYGNLFTINPTEAGTRGFTHLESVDWADQIKQLEKLDLVITVDTSIAHLCGAINKPCWVLMPKLTTDFRWGDSSMGYDNIWYTSVRVIRNPGSWEKTFEHVEQLLLNLWKN